MELLAELSVCNGATEAAQRYPSERLQALFREVVDPKTKEHLAG